MIVSARSRSKGQVIRIREEKGGSERAVSLNLQQGATRGNYRDSRELLVYLTPENRAYRLQIARMR